MDFLDPQKQRAHARRLAAGYVLVTIAILVATVFLLYKAYGYNTGKDGQIVQNGFAYVSSTPAGAKIYLNAKDSAKTTNTRLSLPAGTYTLELARQGYQPWHQTMLVPGGDIVRYDYPFLFPKKLTTTNVKTLSAAPALSAQSPDRRWLLVQRPGSLVDFYEYDLNNPTAPPVVLTIPENVLTPGSRQSLKVVEWSTDNRHILFEHLYDGKHEFIMFDRNTPADSLNLNTKLGINPDELSLLNDQYDQYYVYNTTKKTLLTASLDTTGTKPFLKDVLAYKPYGSDTMLYVSATGAADKQHAAVELLQGGQTYHLRDLPLKTQYLLNITQYSGHWYAALGASSESKVYIYEDPADQLSAQPPLLLPLYILDVSKPNYLSFSANARFIMDENDTHFSVYDIKTGRGYEYTVKQPLDKPQTNAVWMDGYRLDYVSGGQLLVFDFDHGNPQVLMPASPRYPVFFDPNYKYVDSLTPATAKADKGKYLLTSTALRLPADM